MKKIRLTLELAPFLETHRHVAKRLFKKELSSQLPLLNEAYAADLLRAISPNCSAEDLEVCAKGILSDLGRASVNISRRAQGPASSNNRRMIDFLNLAESVSAFLAVLRDLRDGSWSRLLLPELSIVSVIGRVLPSAPFKTDAQSSSEYKR